MSNKLSGRYLAAFLAVLMLGATMSGDALAETVVKTMSQDDIYRIPGLGAIVASEEGRLKILMVPTDRPKEYKAVDMKDGDFILMVNGKRVKTIDELREVFAKAEVGETVEMGLKRGKEMMMTSFPRAKDDEGGGKIMMMTRTMSSDDESGDGKTMIMHGGGGSLSMLAMPEIGILVSDGEDGPEIAGIMPAMGDGSTGAKPAEGDRILSLQGKTVNTVATLEAAYNGIKDGQEVKVEFERDGKKLTTTFTRKQMQIQINNTSN